MSGSTILRSRGGVPTLLRGALPRLFSLVAAIALSALIFVYPQALAHVGHGWLSLVMLGICAGFVHGVGFVPRARLWRIAFSPVVAWALMGVAAWLLLAV